ncbi:MAG: ribosomal protein S18-alanine N-acetyltransferase [Magnetococcales bacterium]|nr:ribosomal protein S18-alanine N-acetyltransferase [Magnetococcales bacterium]
MIRSLSMDAALAREVALLEEEISPSPWSAEMILEEGRLGGWMTVLVSGESTLAGYGVARPLFDEWHLLTLGVAPRFRRQGLGRRLVEELAGVAQARQGRCVVLEVRVSNVSARLLYQNTGFVTVGVRHGYYRDGPYGPEDALVMCRFMNGHRASEGS